MSTKSSEEIFKELQNHTLAKIELVDRSHTMAVYVPPADILSCLRILKKETTMEFDCLMNQTAVHMDDQFLVYWHLFSYTHKNKICVESAIAVEKPVLDSVASLWKSANWLERETYDLFGIIFEGHPDLRRIMLPDDWVGHPLRKEYVRPNWYNDMDNTFSEITQRFEPKKKGK